MNNLIEINITEEIIRKTYWDKDFDKPYCRPQIERICKSWFKEEIKNIFEFRDNYSSLFTPAYQFDITNSLENSSRKTGIKILNNILKFGNNNSTEEYLHKLIGICSYDYYNRYNVLYRTNGKDFFSIVLTMNDNSYRVYLDFLNISNNELSKTMKNWHIYFNDDVKSIFIETSIINPESSENVIFDYYYKFGNELRKF